MAQEVCGDRSQGSHHKRRNRVDRYMRYKPRFRQREPFCQSNHERCARRPYVPVDEFDRTHDHPADVPAVNLRHHDLLHREQQSYNRPRRQDQNPSRPSHIWPGLQHECVDPSGTDYSWAFEGDIAADIPLVPLPTPHVTFPAKWWFFAAYVPYSLTQYSQEFAMSKTAITSPELAPPVGPFSQAVEVGGFLYFSGQVGQDPATGKVVEGGIVAETERVFRNLSAVLKAAGRSFDHVARAGVYLTSMSDFVAMNGIYAKYFSQPFPARTTIAVAALPLGACVEIDLVVKA